MKKVITCAGYHGTGSSIIGEILEEFIEIENLGEDEYRFLQDPNGVGDLESKLILNNNRLNSERAIYDFKKFIKFLSRNRGIYFWKKNIYEKTFNGKFEQITERFLNEIIDIKWQGYWHDFSNRSFKNKILDIYYTFFCKIYRLIFNIKLNNDFRKEMFLKKTMYFSFPIESYDEKVKKYLNNLLESIDTYKKIIYFDQLVPCCNISKYTKYFYNIKVVVLDRDPRDIYVLSKVIWKDQVLPTENVEDYISHFLLLRKHQKFDTENNKIIKRFKFEDFIYDYENTLVKLYDFLDLDVKNRNLDLKKFKPEISINNTQVYLNYPDLQEDINKIEETLGEYCYNFPYKIKNISSKIF